MDLKLELVVLPVSDVDRAKAFYEGAGFRLDVDHRAGDSFRVVQGEFDGTSHVFMPQGDPVAHVDGRISNGSAQGTLRISGKLDPQDASASCKTGSRSWLAERAAAPPP